MEKENNWMYGDSYVKIDEWIVIGLLMLLFLLGVITAFIIEY